MQRGDGMLRQHQVVPEFVLLAGEIRRLDYFTLLPSQVDRLVIDHQGNCAKHQQERRQRQQDEFSSELHACIMREADTGASIALSRWTAYLCGFLSFSLSVPPEKRFPSHRQSRLYRRAH